jgi:hypothetical protein
MSDPSPIPVPVSFDGGAPAWQLRLRAGDPPALDAVTDYGGRFEWARLFVVWREPMAGGVLDPAGYIGRPALLPGRDTAPEIESCPLPGLCVRWQVCVPRAEGIAIGITVVNQYPEPREIELFAVSALRLKAEALPLLPPLLPLRIVREVLTGSAAPGLAGFRVPSSERPPSGKIAITEPSRRACSARRSDPMSRGWFSTGMAPVGAATQCTSGRTYCSRSTMNLTGRGQAIARTIGSA